MLPLISSHAVNQELLNLVPSSLFNSDLIASEYISEKNNISCFHKIQMVQFLNHLVYLCFLFVCLFMCFKTGPVFHLSGNQQQHLSSDLSANQIIFDIERSNSAPFG